VAASKPTVGNTLGINLLKLILNLKVIWDLYKTSGLFPSRLLTSPPIVCLSTIYYITHSEFPDMVPNASIIECFTVFKVEAILLYISWKTSYLPVWKAFHQPSWLSSEPCFQAPVQSFRFPSFNLQSTSSPRFRAQSVQLKLFIFTFITFTSM